MSGSNYELQVTGRSCTMFEDPESAVSVNEGITLIPWMGNKDTLIDRYDVRGHLYSESEFGLMKSPTNVDEFEEEIKEELDKERYMFLTVDELEFEAYLEEEEKRFKKNKNSEGSYGQVAFSYGSSEPPVEESKTASITEEVYVPDRDLAVPDIMITPQTEKHYKIIEKTAAFLSAQNLQTEILIRTKQKDNAQFQFLEPDNVLNPFYKHVLNAIKRGVLVVNSEPKQSTRQQSPVVMDQVPTPLPNVPTVLPEHHYQNKQRQIAYARGKWSKIVEESQHQVVAEPDGGSSLAALSAYGAASDESSDDENDEDATPSLSLYTNNNPMLNGMISSMGKPIPVPQGTPPETIQYLIMSGFVALPPPAPGLPQLLVPPPAYEGFSLPTLPPPPPPPDNEVLIEQQPEDFEDHRPESPEPSQKEIITKLAEYVVKNGDSFEKKVLQKQDARFHFVNPGADNHEYYQYLIQKFRNKRVKLNVAPIKLKTAKAKVRPTQVDNTIFNQSSGDEEDDKLEDEEDESSCAEVSQDDAKEYTDPESKDSQSLAYSQESESGGHLYNYYDKQYDYPEPNHNRTISEASSSNVASTNDERHPLDTDDEDYRSETHEDSQETPSDKNKHNNSPNKYEEDSPHPIDKYEDDSPHPIDKYEDNSPHPIDKYEDDSPHPIDKYVEESPHPIDAYQENSQHPTDKYHEEIPERHPLDSESEKEECIFEKDEDKTPVFTKQNDTSTPSPTVKTTPTIQDDQKTPDYTAYNNSDAESFDSETGGQPIVKHFNDAENDINKYDLDGGYFDTLMSGCEDENEKNTSSLSKTPDKKRSVSEQLKKNSDSEQSRSSSRLKHRDDLSKSKETTERASRSRTPSLSQRKGDKPKRSRSKESKDKHSNNQREKLKSNAKPEVVEEGELSDNSSKSRKSKRHKSDKRHQKTPKKLQKKKKARSKDKATDSEDDQSSKRFRSEKENRKRKRKTPPKRSETDDWVDEQRKKLNKIELLKEIENKLEEKRKLRVSRKNGDEVKDERNAVKNEKIEEKKDNASKISEEKRLAMQKELEEIEAKLKSKKLKKQRTDISEKVNGHITKSSSKKKTKESVKSRKT